MFATILSDVTVLLCGFLSISIEYAGILAVNPYFWVWLGVFLASSFPMSLSFSVLERRAVQFFLIM